VPRISAETIQRVVEASDIVDLIGSYFPLKRAGTAWKALCPFHREKTPSFSVNPQRQNYKCFGCGAGGDAIRFVRDYENVDFAEAVRRLAQRYGVPVIEEAGGADDDRHQELRKRLLAIHAEAAGWFHHNLRKTAEAQAAREYLKSRGITSDVARSWQLGYAPDSWDALLEVLREKRFTLDEIAQSGLVTTKDRDTLPDDLRKVKFYARFRGRVMFPICNDYGEVIAFSGRVLDPEAKTAKYVNSPETPLFTKGRVLYGLFKSKRALIETKTAIVCEGQLDLISAFEAGIHNVIAPQGTAFTAEQARVLRRFSETVILCFDSDRAGQEAVTRSLPALLEHGMDVRVARLPAGEDPDSLIRREGPVAFREVIDGARNFFDHALRVLAERGTLDDPAGKAAAARRLGPYVAAISDKVLREATSKRICTRLGISESAFAQHLKATASRAAEEPTAAPAAPEPLEMHHTISHLCRLAVIDPTARAWLADQPPLPGEGRFAGMEFLRKILAWPESLETPAGQSVFQARLTPPEHAAFQQLDLDRAAPDPLHTAQEWWRGLGQRDFEQTIEESKVRQQDRSLDLREALQLQMTVIQTRLDAARAQLGAGDDALSREQRVGLADVVENLEKQILDLHSRLHDA
jgi:DNA primase